MRPAGTEFLRGPPGRAKGAAAARGRRRRAEGASERRAGGGRRAASGERRAAAEAEAADERERRGGRRRCGCSPKMAADAYVPGAASRDARSARREAPPLRGPWPRPWRGEAGEVGAVERALVTPSAGAGPQLSALRSPEGYGLDTGRGTGRDAVLGLGHGGGHWTRGSGVDTRLRSGDEMGWTRGTGVVMETGDARGPGLGGGVGAGHGSGGGHRTGLDVELTPGAGDGHGSAGRQSRGRGYVFFVHTAQQGPGVQTDGLRWRDS